MSYRPCGACGELVPADKGCAHWRPAAVTVGKPSGASRRKRAAERAAEVDEFRKTMGVTT